MAKDPEADFEIDKSSLDNFYLVEFSFYFCKRALKNLRARFGVCYVS